MRISTSMIYNAGVKTINDQTAKLLHLQQQVSMGRRIVSPSDDPVAASRVLELTQASDVVQQYARNRDNAQGTLSLQETQLVGVGEVISRVRELAVQGGNGSMTSNDRRAVTAELRARFEELMGYANARDGNGRYLFSGYMGDTRPFGGAVETVTAVDPVTLKPVGVQYFGDDGQRMLQVSPSRVIEVSDSGKELFQRIRDGNGNFVTGVAATNQGTAVIDAGAVLDPALWNNAANTESYEIQFWVDTNNVLTTPGKTYYDIVDTVNGNSVFTGNPPDNNPASATFSFSNQYSAGHAIALKGPGNIDLGANVIVNGDPETGDKFTIESSTTQDLFTTLGTLILDLEQAGSGDYQQGLLANRIGFALTNLDQAEQNVLRVRAMVGSRLNEVDSLQSINEDVQLQYQQAISSLQDLDYAKTISDLTRKQTDLQAAQQSFVQTSRLSLFNYL